jgi:hypothetical protein
MQIMSAPELKVFTLEEDHLLMTNFWSQKVRELAGSQTPSPLLLALCDAMVQQHHGMGVQNMMQESQEMGVAQAAGQAPGAIGQAMLQQATQPPDAKDPKKAATAKR